MNELYDNIRKFRIQSGLTQDELAKKTGYTDRSSIAKIERGDVDLPQSKIMLFAQALGVDAGTLMGNMGIVTQSISLLPDEAALLNDYQKLNDLGKNMSRVYVSDLADNPKYQNVREESDETGFTAG